MVSKTDQVLRAGHIMRTTLSLMSPTRSRSVLDTSGVLRAPGRAYECVACCFLMNIDTWFAFWNVLDPELGQLPQ